MRGTPAALTFLVLGTCLLLAGCAQERSAAVAGICVSGGGRPDDGPGMTLQCNAEGSYASTVESVMCPNEPMLRVEGYVEAGELVVEISGHAQGHDDGPAPMGLWVGHAGWNGGKDVGSFHSPKPLLRLQATATVFKGDVTARVTCT